MIPVEQTIIDPDRGDCFQACIASLLEIPLQSVPVYRSTGGLPSPLDRYNTWLAPFGLGMVYITHHGPIPGYCIKSVPSFHFEGRTHAVISLDGYVVWDPNPLNEDRNPSEYKEWFGQYLIYQLDPKHQGYTSLATLEDLSKD